MRHTMQTKRLPFASVQPVAGLRNPSRRRPLPGAFLTAGAFALWMAAAVPAHAQFTIIDPPGSVDATAASINSHGAVVGSYTLSTGGPHGFLRTALGDFTTFDPPGSIE